MLSIPDGYYLNLLNYSMVPASAPPGEGLSSTWLGFWFRRREASELAFLTLSQVWLLVPEPHFENHSLRGWICLYPNKGLLAGVSGMLAAGWEGYSGGL